MFDLNEAKRIKQQFDDEVSSLKIHIATDDPTIVGIPSQDALAEALEDFDADGIAQFIIALIKYDRALIADAREESQAVIREFKADLRGFVESLGE
jgi:hypothetical protein